MDGGVRTDCLHLSLDNKPHVVRLEGVTMNMNNAPKQDQLRELLYACDDTAGDHVLWADGLGEVHITLLFTESLANWIQRMNGKVQFQYDAYVKNNGKVGQAAANDSVYVAGLFKKLLKDWQNRKDGPVFLS
jgi:hypothetical protein